MSVTAVGKDHPGIVAAVTGVLYELGCNLDDCAMSLLSGQFAMIMLLEAPDDLGPDRLSLALDPAAEQVGISVSVTRVDPVLSAAVARPYVVSVYGADHPGIVYRVTAQLFAQGVNITNLLSRSTPGDLYTVVVDIDVPEGTDPTRLGESLQAVARAEGVELQFRPADLEIL